MTFERSECANEQIILEGKGDTSNVIIKGVAIIDVEGEEFEYFI